MNIVQSSAAYEEALRRATKVDEKGLRQKHEAMAGDVFSHLRATYYRWVELFPMNCPELAKSGSPILGVGDLHVQNFGTWRDAEGRLVWGIDDFDEADQGLSVASDLLRLAVSATFTSKIQFPVSAICSAVLDGYEMGLGATAPFVLEEKHQWLLEMAIAALDGKSPKEFWSKWLMKKTVPLKRADMDKTAVAALTESYPTGSVPESFRGMNPASPKGLGSLGRRRFFAYNADWRGGPIAREAKAAVPPATRIKEKPFVTFVDSIQQYAIRSPDPVYRLHGRWVCKAILATTGRIEMGNLAKETDQAKLLRAMGHETANVHRGAAGDVAPLQKTLKKLSPKVLEKSVNAMRTAIERDWAEWKKFWNKSAEAGGVRMGR